jgi:diamine N-acetyltransferase
MKIELNSITGNNKAQILKWKSDPILANEIMSEFKIVTEDEVESWINLNSNDKNQVLKGIYYTTENKKTIVGVVRLMFIDFESKNAELGIYIGDSNTRGKGIGKKALELIIKLGFKELKLNKIYLKVNSKNENAIKLYLNTGFIIEGKLEDHYYNTGTNMYEDIICMALFNS